MPRSHRLLITGVNGVQVGMTELTGWHPQFLEFTIPSGTVKPEADIVVQFAHPNAVVPAEHNISPETRALAIAFMRLTVVRLLAPA